MDNIEEKYFLTRGKVILFALALIILIICCLFNIVSKIVKKHSLKEELRQTAQYVLNHKK